MKVLPSDCASGRHASEHTRRMDALTQKPCAVKLGSSLDCLESDKNEKNPLLKFLADLEAKEKGSSPSPKKINYLTANDF